VREFKLAGLAAPVPLNNQFNPDVTVRRRGVMEKCTFCIQRIRRVEDLAHSENRPVMDGEVQPACAQACPASAIVFGRIDDPNSQVSRLALNSRNYKMLEDLGTPAKGDLPEGRLQPCWHRLRHSSVLRLIPKNPRIQQNTFCWILARAGN